MANQIKKYREAAKMTQSELAEKINVSRQTIVRYETECSEPRWSDVLAIADSLGCTADELMGGSANPTPTPAEAQGCEKLAG